MSWNVFLVDEERKIYEVKPHVQGGTQEVPISTQAWLNITYNYSDYYSTPTKAFPNDEGLKWLHGKKASDTIEYLTYIVPVLGTLRDKDYWKCTAGNAGFALSILLEFARQHPNGIWVVE